MALEDLKLANAAEPAAKPTPNTTRKPASDESRFYDSDYFTDITAGRRYAKLIDGSQVYVNEWKEWAIYEPEGVWSHDLSDVTTQRLFDYIEGIYAEVETNGNKAEQAEAKALMGLRRAQAVQRVASTALTVSSREFDRQKDHLLVANGVVDLRTGELRDVTPEDRFTKRSTVAYKPEATSPLLQKLLAAFPADTHEYLQVLAGQALTGYQPSTNNASIFFFNGDGRNGKSTFVDCLEQIAGTSAVRLDPSVLLSGAGANNQFAFMPFKGARLAIFEELPDAKHLDIQAVKSVAGTDKKRASEKFQKSEEVEITATIFIATNFLPAVAESDMGTWRRLVVIPSPYTFLDAANFNANDPTHRSLTPELVGAKNNIELLEALMAWAIEGAAKWYANDKSLLGQPVSIREASAKWQNRDDKLGWWLEDELVVCAGSFVLTEDAYDSYKAYTRGNGQVPQSYQQWIETLKRSAKAKEMGIVAGKGRHSSLRQSFYVPEQRYKAKEVSDFAKEWQPRVAPVQASIIRDVCFKSDAPKDADTFSRGDDRATDDLLTDDFELEGTL